MTTSVREAKALQTHEDKDFGEVDGRSLVSFFHDGELISLNTHAGNWDILGMPALRRHVL
jgi:hypothetical protein